MFTGECPNPVVPRGPLPHPLVVLAPFLDLPLPAHSVHTAHHSLSPSIPLCRPHQLPQYSCADGTHNPPGVSFHHREKALFPGEKEAWDSLQGNSKWQSHKGTPGREAQIPPRTNHTGSHSPGQPGAHSLTQTSLKLSILLLYKNSTFSSVLETAPMRVKLQTQLGPSLLRTRALLPCPVPVGANASAGCGWTPT